MSACVCGVTNRDTTTIDWARQHEIVWRHGKERCHQVCFATFESEGRLFRCSLPYGHDAGHGSSDGAVLDAREGKDG